MRSSLLLLALLFTANIKPQDIWIGQTSVFDLRGYAIGGQIKGQYNGVQLALGSTYNVHNKHMQPLVTLGYYFVNHDHLKIGSNVQFDNYISFPSVNITKQLNHSWFMDINVRPHTYTFLQANFSLFILIKQKGAFTPP